MRLAPLSTIPPLLLSLFAAGSEPTPIPGFMLETLMGLDVTGRVFLFFTSSIWLISGLYSLSYFNKEEQAVSFFTFYLLTLTGNIGLIFAQDLVSFYLFFAWMSFSAYGLIVHSATHFAHYAGKITISLVVIGEMLIFLSLIFAANGSSSLAFTDAAANIASSPYATFIFALIFLGFGIKAGALPLHVWLPLAHPAAPTPASAVLSACMIKAGLLGWIRLLPFGFSGFSDWGYFMMTAGLVAAFYAVFIGLTQKKPKAILAYSSISQMGIITMVAGAAWLMPDMWPTLLSVLLIYVSFHAFVKAALFLSVETANMSLDRPIARCWHGAALVLPALALSGSPFTFGLIAKSWVKQHAITGISASKEIAVLFDASSIATALLLARFLFLTWPKKQSAQPFKGGMYVSWTALVLIVALSPLLTLFPLVTELVGSYSFLPYKPYEFLPILGAVLIAATAITRHWKTPVSIPEGDVLIFYLSLIKISQQIVSSLLGVLKDRTEKMHTFRGRVSWPKPVSLESCGRVFDNWSILGSVFFALVIVFFLLQISAKTPHTPRTATTESPQWKVSQKTQ